MVWQICVIFFCLFLVPCWIAFLAYPNFAWEQSTLLLLLHIVIVNSLKNHQTFPEQSDFMFFSFTVLSPFQIISCFTFVLSQTCLTLTKFIDQMYKL